MKDKTDKVILITIILGLLVILITIFYMIISNKLIVNIIGYSVIVYEIFNTYRQCITLNEFRNKFNTLRNDDNSNQLEYHK